MKLIALLCLLSLTLISCATALDWSEIFFNPLGADNNKEYVLLLGNDSLVGCQIRDASSADSLILLHTGFTERIAILENNSEWLAATENDTVYVIGAAIGNGLSNTKDDLTILCNGTSILSTSYDIATIADFAEGTSIVYSNNLWMVGPVNGTLGVQETKNSENRTPENSQKPAANTEQAEIMCNDTLLITVSATKGVVGENVSFTTIASAFTTFEAQANGEIVDWGNNLGTSEHTVALPNASSMRITAYNTACGREQRASRIIAITLPPNKTVEPEEEIVEVANSIPIALVLHEEETAEAKEITPIAAVTTERVIVDDNASIIPWICAFGIITLLVSVKIFFSIKKEAT